MVTSWDYCIIHVVAINGLSTKLQVESAMPLSVLFEPIGVHTLLYAEDKDTLMDCPCIVKLSARCKIPGALLHFILDTYPSIRDVRGRIVISEIYQRVSCKNNRP